MYKWEPLNLIYLGEKEIKGAAHVSNFKIQRRKMGFKSSLTKKNCNNDRK